MKPRIGHLDRTGCGGGRQCFGYELVADIDLASYAMAPEGWLPIGSCQGKGFSAVFEGNNYTLSGLSINRPQQNCVGFFAKVDGGEIRNLLVEAIEIIGDDNVGALVGSGNATIRNCAVNVATGIHGDGSYCRRIDRLGFWC